MECCKNCVAPKRHTACWGHCPDYETERAEYDRRKAIADHEKDVAMSIYYQKSDSVHRALKKHGTRR